MKKLYSGSLSADHKQFYLLDASFQFNDSLYEWNLERGKLGYICNDQAITIRTVSDYYIHWVEVLLCETLLPVWDECERALALNLNLPSGKLRIDSTYWYAEVIIDLSPGCYIVYILAYNLDKQPDSDTDDLLEDNELEKRTDLERYKIILVPGQTMNEGVIKGSKYLPDCIDEED